MTKENHSDNSGYPEETILHQRIVEIDSVKGMVFQDEEIVRLHNSIQLIRSETKIAKKQGSRELVVAMATGVAAGFNAGLIVPGTMAMGYFTVSRRKHANLAGKEFLLLQDRLGNKSDQKHTQISKPSNLPEIKLVDGRLGFDGKLFIPSDVITYFSSTLENVNTNLEEAHKYIVIRTLLAYTMCFTTAIEGSCDMLILLGPIVYFNKKAMDSLGTVKKSLNEIDETPGISLLIEHARGLQKNGIEVKDRF